MQHSHAIRQTSKFQCQLLTCSTLAAALLFETRGLMDDLSMAGARATVRVQMSTMTLGSGTSSLGFIDRQAQCFQIANRLQRDLIQAPSYRTIEVLIRRLKRM